MARTLIYDIETAPDLGWVWQRWQTNVIDVDTDWTTLSFAWKWLGEKSVHAMALPDCRKPKSDRELVAKLHELFDSADIVIAHNGVKFDQPKMRARMLVHGMAPPSPFKEVDTLQIARRQFGFSSNKLDDLARQLGIGRKVTHTGFDLWRRCMSGTVLPGSIDAGAWRTMVRYNRHDVRLLEAVYLRLRPWAKNHPNVAAIDDKPNTCPRCGVEGQMISRGWNIASATRRPRFQCKACGGWCAGRSIYKSGATSFVAGTQ